MANKKIEQDFKKFKKNVLGILLFGSKANNAGAKNSDIDVCLVSGKKDNKKLFNQILESGATNKYDVKIFEDLPWKIKGTILEENKTVWAKKPSELSYYLQKFNRIWLDQKLELKKLGIEIFT